MRDWRDDIADIDARTHCGWWVKCHSPECSHTGRTFRDKGEAVECAITHADMLGHWVHVIEAITINPVYGK